MRHLLQTRILLRRIIFLLLRHEGSGLRTSVGDWYRLRLWLDIEILVKVLWLGETSRDASIHHIILGWVADSRGASLLKGSSMRVITDHSLIVVGFPVVLSFLFCYNRQGLIPLEVIGWWRDQRWLIRRWKVKLTLIVPWVCLILPGQRGPSLRVHSVINAIRHSLRVPSVQIEHSSMIILSWAAILSPSTEEYVSARTTLLVARIVRVALTLKFLVPKYSLGLKWVS